MSKTIVLGLFSLCLAAASCQSNGIDEMDTTTSVLETIAKDPLYLTLLQSDVAVMAYYRHERAATDVFFALEERTADLCTRDLSDLADQPAVLALQDDFCTWYSTKKALEKKYPVYLQLKESDKTQIRMLCRDWTGYDHNAALIDLYASAQ